MKSHYRKHVIVTTLLALFFIAGCFGLWKFGGRMKVKHDHVRSIKEQLATYIHNKKVFAEETQILKKMSDRVAVFEEKRITAAKVPDLLSSIEKIAERHELNFRVTTVQVPKEEAEQWLSISMTGKGSLNQVNAFLDELRAQAYEVQFDRFTLTQEQLALDAPAGTVALWELNTSVFILSYKK